MEKSRRQAHRYDKDVIKAKSLLSYEKSRGDWGSADRIVDYLRSRIELWGTVRSLTGEKRVGERIKTSAA